jgi:hypothetical protein
MVRPLIGMVRHVDRDRLAASCLALSAAPFVALAVHCGAATPGPRASTRVFPAYDHHATELFDDGFEPEAVGFPTEHAVTPASDLRLRERTQTGDAVVRARVMTVDEDSTQNWSLALHTQQVLHESKGSGPAPGDFTLRVEPTDPAAGIVNSMSSRLVGRTFIIFMRSFARGQEAQAPSASPPPDAPPADNEPDLHFHIAMDSKDEMDAIRSAILLSEVQ